MQMIHSDPAPGVAQLTDRLRSALQANESVLWLVPGGSNIPLVVQVQQALTDSDTSRLTIMLTDERYGDVGHAESNHTQLLAAGFEVGNAHFIPVLTAGKSLSETVNMYAQTAQNLLETTDEVIAQFGIGSDGHIAGILPYSDAAKSSEYVAGYQTETFTRITLTFDALRYIDAAYAFVYGDEKRAALQKLRDHDVPLIEQPSQILKELTESYVYNDQIGENE